MIARLFSRRTAAPVSHAWCTYFDSAFLARGVTMLRSLRRHDPSARILVLALDELCARVLGDWFAGELCVIGTQTLHARVPELLRIRRERSAWAYYATQKPAWALFAMERRPRPESLFYVDADTWFFSDPAPIFAEAGPASVGIVPSRFHASLHHLSPYGTYNAGCIYWRNDKTGRRALADWRDDCLNWCAEEPQPDGRFMNQGYLNAWPARYQGVHAFRHPGVDLAPWNVDGHLLAGGDSGVTVDGHLLIFHHFSSLGRDAGGRWLSYYPRFERQFDLVCELVYHPYLLAVEAESRKLKEAYGIEGTGDVKSKSAWTPCFELQPRA